MTRSNEKPRRWRLWAGGAVAAVVLAFGLGEAMGWPFLAAPMQRWLGHTLARRVVLGADAAVSPKVTIHLLGGLEIVAERIEIGAPAWSAEPHTLLVTDARMTLGYADLWRASGGVPLRIRELRAAALDAHVERLADGRASWQFGAVTDTPDTSAPAAHVPAVGRLTVGLGSLHVRDALSGADVEAKFSLADGSEVPLPSVAASAPAAGLQLHATGTYQKHPLRIDIQTTGLLPVVADNAAAVALPVTLDAHVGSAVLSFRGTTTDTLHLRALKGRFSVQGPSLAAVGDPLRVTLPTTGPFRTEGLLAKEGKVWKVVLEHIDIGASRLAGAFTYDARTALPMLAGRLTGTKLLLADLGPAVGTPVGKASAAVAPVAPMPASQRATRKPGHVLPNREFDLPALRAMDANVLIAIDGLDLGKSFLEPLAPLRTHLVLAGGVLTLRELEARTGQGRLAGTVQLDGHDAQALWTADLRWDGVRLESWIHQARADRKTPYATGTLNGQARVAGQGKSTATILGSLRGGVRMQLEGGTISHLAVEAAGLDIAQGLGLLNKGDDNLPIDCSVVDLVAEQGLLKPRVLVLDTRDSTLWVDGSLSLATEALDLRVIVTPKDFSPLALRTPLQLRGTFAEPSITLDKGRLGARLGASALLGLLNPFAALIPLIDFGNSADSQRDADKCRALSARIAAKPGLPAPGRAPTAARG